jgi:hypothetical protein
MPASFVCPGCKAVLRAQEGVSAGREVKCARCATIFAAKEMDIPPSPASAAGAFTLDSGRSTPGVAEPPPANVRAGLPPAIVFDARPSRPGHEAEEDLAWARRRLHKAQRHDNPKALVLASGAGLLLLLFVSGFVWPGFFHGGETAQPDQENPGELAKGTGQEDLLCFVASGASVFAGVNLNLVEQGPAGQPLQMALPMAIQLAMQRMPGAPLRILEFLSNVERGLIALNFKEGAGHGPVEGTVVVRTKRPYAAEKLRQLFKSSDQPEQVNGKTIYRLSGLIPRTVAALHMPNDRVVVLVFGAEERLANVLSFNGHAPQIAPEAFTEVRAAEQGLAWAAAEVTPPFQELLATLNPNLLAIYAPELKAALGPLERLKGAHATFDLLPAQKVKFRLSATCASDADSEQLKQALHQFWQDRGKMYLAMVRAFMPANVAQGPAAGLDDLVSGLTVTRNGPQVAVNVELAGPGMPDQANPFPGGLPQGQMPQLPIFQPAGRLPERRAP